MNRKLFFFGITLALFLASVNDVAAQRRRRGGTNPTDSTKSTTPTTPAPDTTGNPQNNNNNGQPPTFNPYANLPIAYDTVSNAEVAKIGRAHV